MKCKGADPVAGAIKEERTSAIDDRFLHSSAWFKGVEVWVTLVGVVLPLTPARSVSEGSTSTSLTLRVGIAILIPAFEPCQKKIRTYVDSTTEE